MKKKEKDEFLEEIDVELHALNKKLREVMKEADALLSKHFDEAEENDALQGDETSGEQVDEK